MQINILTEKQKELLPYLKDFRRKFYLVGGTAIALYIGHRRSIDFDLFCTTPFQHRDIHNKIFRFPFSKNKIFEDSDQIHFIMNDVKVTFFHYPYPLPHAADLNKIIKMPDLASLAAMKAFALGRRAKWKDYVDLYFLIKDHFSIEIISELALSYFGGLFSEKLFREQLAFHKDIDFSEPVEYLTSEPSEQEIKQFLVDKALEFKL
jgi:hypothetical protein